MVTDAGVQPQAPRPRRYGPPQQNGPREQRRPYNVAPTRRVCALCKDKNLRLDYKRADMLQRYITDRGNIQGRRRTGFCARHQRRLALAIKRARHLALLPYTAAHLRRS